MPAAAARGFFAIHALSPPPVENYNFDNWLAFLVNYSHAAEKVTEAGIDHIRITAIGSLLDMDGPRGRVTEQAALMTAAALLQRGSKGLEKGQR
jgi:hypothetical protein